MVEKSKILIITGTIYIKKFIIEVSVKAGHLTYILLRESKTLNPFKDQLIKKFKTLGVNFLHVGKTNISITYLIIICHAPKVG